MDEVSRLYDLLYEYERGKRTGKVYPIHKRLDLEQIDETRGMEDITELILQLLPRNTCLKILDAGCGVGFSLGYICLHSNHHGLGISLSPKELNEARTMCDDPQLEGRLNFREASFDDDLGDTFDVIIAMESLKHSPNWKQSLNNLVNHLNVGGYFFLLEDYCSPLTPEKIADRFQALWSVPHLYTEAEVVEEANRRNLKLRKNFVLDLALPKRSAFLSQSKARMCALLTTLVSTDTLRGLLNVYEGGLWMEYLYAKGFFQYRLSMFQKQAYRADGTKIY